MPKRGRTGNGNQANRSAKRGRAANQATGAIGTNVMPFRVNQTLGRRGQHGRLPKGVKLSNILKEFPANNNNGSPARGGARARRAAAAATRKAMKPLPKNVQFIGIVTRQFVFGKPKRGTRRRRA